MRGLAVRLEGRLIRHAQVHRPALRWALPPGLDRRLTAARVTGFRRRAKYILMRLDGNDTVLLHLGMSGRMAITEGPPPAPVAHEHIVLHVEDGWRIALVDPRRFGSVHLVGTAAEDEHHLLRHLGPEPLSDRFDAAALAASLAGRRTPVKVALLDQRIVAGLGNIYVCEALYRARIDPRRAAASLSAAEIARVVPAVQTVLSEAIAAGGSSLRDYVQPNGELGMFQHAWQVYGREGQPCPDCPGAPPCPGVVRFTQAGRSSFACPRLQT